MNRIYAIVGKACAGKDSIVKELSNRTNLSIATSFTTRPMREGEHQGVEYNFIDNDTFMKLKDDNQIVEYTSYTVASGEVWYYGLTKEELEKNEFVLVIVNPTGVKSLKELYGDKVKVILITADDKERIKRYLNRDNTNNVAECCRRFLADEKDFKGFESDYVLTNENLDCTVEKLRKIIGMDIAHNIMKDINRKFKNNPAMFFGR
jgi:guanylate kinase